ncbi:MULTISPECIES: DsrE family protein [Alloalcanivorax]|jgi:intracellular sulfur oxidation DsrE/DsrF family protein|uniref:DsrE family protein n=2 Tax=Alloalcanivorax TaxID=3020832 RepID=A0A9Q3W4R5_9GAMM|nr:MULTISPECIES: DsrE family protein [Alloalcanivorax]ERS10418.1 multidrug transporter [Alcanivorax sp. PN-3]KYZ87571.1 multidrug transporter [Alcanivorax sp. KX64203]MBA4721720.1 DsrE family protein [Alcanivorax sp.]ARB46401.1 multidrug transporter [Alloalcanivorax xenomutans]MCE7507777.1 DsrE family protein [Alloalcanivorax xenomutans]|tara:strand:- start:314 stop:640 length:327 start_codon:yes stop_codon:yes gene_type:complete
MSDYLFIQSQDPFTEVRCAAQYQLARQLRDAGHRVHVLLVQNGVAPARLGARSEVFDALLGGGVTVSADGFSLKQREIEASDLKAEVTVGDVGDAVDALLAGSKVIWN